MTPHLVVVLPSVPVAGGRVQLADKTVTGLRGFVERWPGRVTAVGPSARVDIAGNLGLKWYRTSDLDCEIMHGDALELVRRLGPDVLHLSLAVRERALLELGIPAVVFAENPALERLRYALSGAPRSRRPRMFAGAVRQEIVQRSMVRSASALACNGWNAWDWYARPARRANLHQPLLVFDSRITSARVAEAERRVNAGSRIPGPLRLGFSGRLHAAKGPQYAIAASRELERRGVDHQLTVFGAGPLEAELRGAAGRSVHFAGEARFDPSWLDQVSEHIDVMLLPHTQGDPSGTYLESAGLGVPIVGFDNAALRGFQRAGGFAWAAARRSGVSLADVVERLDGDRRELHQAARNGVSFAKDHAFEKAFDARAAQLVRVAGL